RATRPRTPGSGPERRRRETGRAQRYRIASYRKLTLSHRVWFRLPVNYVADRLSGCQCALGRRVVVSRVPVLTVPDAPSSIPVERADLEDRAGRALRGRGTAVGRDRGAQFSPALHYRQHRDRADRRPGDGAGGSGRPQARHPERPRRERLPPDDPGAAAGGLAVPLHRQLVSGRGPETVLLRLGRPRGRARDERDAPRRAGAGAAIV